LKPLDSTAVSGIEISASGLLTRQNGVTGPALDVG
jgi:hypothetical protein